METQATLGLFARLSNLVFSPSKTFESLIAKPDWVTPMIVTAVITLTFSLTLKDVIIKFQTQSVRESIMKNEQIADSQKPQMADQAVDMMKKFWVVGAVIGSLTAVGLYFIIGLVYWLVANMLLGGKPPFFQALSIYGYAALIEILGLIIKMPIMASTASMRVDTGLALLAPDAELTSATYAVLSRFDLFAIWALILIIMGFSRLYQKPTGKSALAVGLVWVAGVIVAVGMSMMGMSMGGL